MILASKKTNQVDYEYFTIYDTKIDSYRMPMAAVNKFDMIRQIESLFRSPEQKDNQLITNAEDFQLFKIGEYEVKTGTFTAQRPQHVANLHEIKASLRQKEPVALQGH